MSDLTCAVRDCPTRVARKPHPMASAYDGIYRCEACSRAFLTAGGSEYSDAQLATFARIDNIDRRPKE